MALYHPVAASEFATFYLVCLETEIKKEQTYIIYVDNLRDELDSEPMCNNYTDRLLRINASVPP